eukprot:TRINITY_DN103883_c0_g1_i1.p1 TRINITY_DN103883_c0_g1~~TRINITY_DN103883_c0_g1_i1.p1  ORF type:complete len:579 (+),score=45.90 TRINITY_DN103883_c0_g1_i1:42-1778(+)
MRFAASSWLFLLFVGTTIGANLDELVDKFTMFNLTTKTFRSPPVSLKSGQIANTPNDWGPLDWPEGPIAIHMFQGNLVDEEGKQVPLSEVYVHHWLIFALDGYTPLHNDGVCSPLLNVYGIGAELRGEPYLYPEPYAMVTTGKEKWTANLHFIRTTNVPDVQDCIECRCPDSDPPKHPRGSVGCCPDGGQCYGMHNSTHNDAKNYYLEYTIGYTEVTPKHIPLTIYSMDATASDTYDCHVDYNIPGPLGEGETNTLVGVSDVPANMSVVYLEMHQHIGAVNFTVDHIRNGHEVRMCNTTPIYGSGGHAVPGNETGYLVKIPYCTWEADKPFVLREGDKIRMTSVYSGQTLPGGHPWHAGVMGLIYMHAHTTKPTQTVCIDHFEKLCGRPPYKDENKCKECASRNWMSLKSKCTIAMVEEQCQITGGTGDIPAPADVPSMSLNVSPYPPTAGQTVEFTVTGPSNTWFAVGFNAEKPLMEDGLGMVYQRLDGATSATLEERVLGNHNAGKVINANYPHEVQTSATTTVVKFKHVWTGGKANCWLFAHGEVFEGMQLQYHGATRGYSCGYPKPAIGNITLV